MRKRESLREMQITPRKTILHMFVVLNFKLCLYLQKRKRRKTRCVLCIGGGVCVDVVCEKEKEKDEKR